MSLKSELELINAYIEIEKDRFGERLKIIYNIDETLLHARVLPLTIQPLVENAIRHGILPKELGGSVKINIQKLKSHILISVEDDGVGMNKNQDFINREKIKEKDRVGVGLVNISRRILREYGIELQIESIEGKGTKVYFEIPYDVNIYKSLEE